MDSKLKKIVKEGHELIDGIPSLDDPKRKILLNRAKKAIETFHVAVNRLLQQD